MSESINDIVRIISKLESSGMAYRASDGGMYFSLESYEACGYKYHKLRRPSIQNGLERVDQDVKKDSRDFILWKPCKDSTDQNACWDSPWGVGRPGWHIECSAMSIL